MVQFLLDQVNKTSVLKSKSVVGKKRKLGWGGVGEGGGIKEEREDSIKIFEEHIR